MSFIENQKGNKTLPISINLPWRNFEQEIGILQQVLHFMAIFVLATWINSNLNRIDFWLIWHVSSIEYRQQYVTAWQNHPNRKCLWYPAKTRVLCRRDQNCFILNHFGDKKKLAILTSKKKSIHGREISFKPALKEEQLRPGRPEWSKAVTQKK